jgi:cell wall-associated NlpC family hydrolase
MAVSTPTVLNSFTPTATRPEQATWASASVVPTSQRAYGDLSSGLGGAAQAVDDFLRSNGKANPPFNTSTSGRLTEANGRLQITRGFIRRSAPDSGDAMSQGRLNFMYNPTEITRDYVSYLDQAALDPFNTIYDSGNLVTAPNFVNFSFTLLFDRQIEATARGNKGVLLDYRYFDMVVRNVPPSPGSSGVPDNGIMMANPKDITVVFSKDLTVQGRPTNARVQFIKFNREMVPTRMMVSLTMIITYFGPLRPAVGLDTFQKIAKYEALVPYSQVHSEAITSSSLTRAIQTYRDSQLRVAFLSNVAPRLSPLSNVFNSGGGGGGPANGVDSQVAGSEAIADRSSSDLRVRTLYNAKKLADSRPLTYRWGAKGPNQYDCSGFVSEVYKMSGIPDVLPVSNVDGIIQANARAGWNRSMQLLASSPRGLSLATLKAKAKPGCVLARHNFPGRVNHIMIADGWDGDVLKVVEATSYPKPNGVVGRNRVSARQLVTYTHVFAPLASRGLQQSSGPRVRPLGVGTW